VYILYVYYCKINKFVFIKSNRKKMKKLICILFLILFFGINSYSQTITFTDIDVTSFPTVKTSFIALDANGDSYTDISSKDFQVYENGVQIPQNLLQVDCKISPMKVVLVLDKSTSMQDTVNGIRKWDWVVKGAETFINDFQFTNGSAIALTTFGGQSNLKADFTQNKQLLFDSIATIFPYGKTNFNAAFMGPYVGAIELLKDQPANFRRIIVFLTDGQHDDPESPSVLVDSISNQLIGNNIQLYAITLLTDPNKDLNLIAGNSGGNYYVVDKENQLDNIYMNIANQIKDRILCTLSWPTSLVCDEIERWKYVLINYIRHAKSITKLYQVPDNGVSKITSDEITYKFGNPNIGSYTDVNITIESDNSPASISNISFSPPTYFTILDYGDGQGSTPTYPINLAMGQKLILKARFTPQSIKTFRKANLQITSSPCNTIIPVVGGIPEINITHPLENDIFSMCDSIDINWTGVDQSTPTDIWYSTNDGTNWTSIIKGAKGNTYKWRPNFEQENILVKTEVSPAQTYVWAMSGGGEYNDNAEGIALSNDQSAIYVCGYFSGPATVSNKFVSNLGGTDAFLAKYDLDGNLIWIASDGGRYNDSAFSVVTDNQNNVYYVGSCYSDAKFGQITPPMLLSSPYLFIAKYDANGNIINANTFGGNNQYPFFQAYGRSVKVVGNNIQVTGLYTGMIKIGNTTLAQANSPTPFTINYDKNLNMLNFYAGGSIQYVTQVTDKDNFIYQVTNFTNYKDFDRFTVKSQGGFDYAVTKFGLSSEGFDISKPFNIYKPIITADSTMLYLGSCLIGDTCRYTFPALIKNTGKVPSTISGFSVSGALPYTNYITVDSSIIGKTLNPGDTIDLNLTMNSYSRGTLNVNLNISGDCNEAINLPIQAYTDCQTKTIDTINFGNVFVGSQLSLPIDCLIENLNGVPLVIHPIIQGQNGLDFLLQKVQLSDTVLPKSCYPVNAIFKPNQLGLRTARINLMMDDVCGNQIIYLVGTGINPNAVIPNEVDWKVRRINKQYDSVNGISIYNPTTSPLVLQKITWQDTPSASEFSYNQSLPLNIPPQSTVYIPVSFYPTDDIYYEKELILSILNKDSISEFPVKLKGTGFYPELSYNWDCGPSVKVGDTTIGTLSITNTSKNSVLSINRILLSSVSNIYSWVNGSEPSNESIQPQETKKYLVYFTPIDTQVQTNTIVIMADNYDGLFPDFWRDNRFDINCQSVGINYPQQVDFGNRLQCTSNILDATLKNQSQDTQIVLDLPSATITGDINNAFHLITNQVMTINPSGQSDIQIQYNPQKPGVDKAVLSIPNNLGIDIKINLVGNSKIFSLSTNTSEFAEIPGKKVPVSVILKVDKLEESITNLKILINYQPQQVRFDAQSFENSVASNWTWKQPDLSQSGVVALTGNGELSTPFNGEIAKINMMFLLDTNKLTNLVFTSVYDCNEISENVAQVRTLPVCLNDSRNIIVTLSNSPTLELINPNPSIDYFTLKFSCGKAFKAIANMYNSMGIKVKSLINQDYKAGIFEEQINVEDLQPGVYFIEFGDGITKEYQKIVITK
jgi:Mg-chelatase subunit ChlD